MESKKQGLSLKMLIGCVLTMVALLNIIAGIDKPHLNPFTTTLECSMISTKLDGDNGSFYIDSQGERLLFTNAEGELVHVVLTSESELPISLALGASLENDHVFVHGIEQISSGFYFSSESILEFDSKGNYLQETERLEYDEEDRVSTCQLPMRDCPSVKSLLNIMRGEFSASIPYSVSFFVSNLLYWLSVFWVIILLCYVSLRHIINNPDNHKELLIFSGIILIMISVGFYSKAIIGEIKQAFKTTIIQNTIQTATVLETRDMDFLEQCVRDGADEVLATPSGKEHYDAINEFIITTRQVFAPDRSINTVIYLVKDSQKLIYLTDSIGHYQSDEATSISPNQVDTFLFHDPNEIIIANDSILGQPADAATVWNEDGTPVAVVVVYGSQTSIIQKQRETVGDLFITLLAIYIGVVMVLVIIKSSISDIRRFASRDPEDKGGKSADMAGVYNLIYRLATGADSVLVVYIASSLCSSYDSSTRALLTALPISGAAAGQWIGTVLATPIIRKLGKRKAGVVSGILGIAFGFVMIYAIINPNIFLYTLGRTLENVVLCGVVYVLVDTLPYQATSPEDRSQALSSSTQSGTAAEILTALLGGFISEYVGYSTIYIFGIIMCAILILLTMLIFDDESEDESDSEQEEQGSALQYWTIFLKPEMLMYFLFYAVPYMLIGGYKSYLFPMFSASAGISALLLSNLTVFTKTAEYFTYDSLTGLGEQHGTGWALFVPQLLICIGLICFLLSPNIYWAIIMLFVCTLLRSISTKESKLYRTKVAEKYDLDATLVQSNYGTINSALYTLQSPALTAFVSLGMSLACAAVGLVCGGMYSIFGVYYKKRDPVGEISDGEVSCP